MEGGRSPRVKEKDPRVLKVTIISLENHAGSGIDPSWWLYFSLSWVRQQQPQHSDSSNKLSSATTTSSLTSPVVRTKAKRDGVWDETLFLDLPEAASDDNSGSTTLNSGGTSINEGGVLRMELWAWGRVHSELCATMEMSLRNIKALVGGGERNAHDVFLEIDRDFWLQAKKNKQLVADVRVGFEFSRRSDIIRRQVSLLALSQSPFHYHHHHSGNNVVAKENNTKEKDRSFFLSVAGSGGSLHGSSNSVTTMMMMSPRSLSPASSTQSSPRTNKESEASVTPPPIVVRGEEKVERMLIALSSSSEDDDDDDEDEKEKDEDEKEEDVDDDDVRGKKSPTLSDDDGYLAPAGSEMLTKMYTAHCYDDAISDPNARYVPFEESNSRSSSSNNSNNVNNMSNNGNGLGFNDQWQHAVEGLVEKESLATYEKISDLSISFVSAATRYAEIIIRERDLPDELKTVKLSRVGGIIGGDKYFVESCGIMFKLAKDAGILKSTEAASKVAGLELKNLTTLFNTCLVHKIKMSLPFLVLVDYAGYRVVALSRLPVNSATLIHGSADGGKNIRSDGEAERKMSDISSRLGLKVHTFSRVSIPLAVDVEVHRGLDGRMYMLDLSRVFPPEEPLPSLTAPHLFRMLRPELVRGNMQPLCSDAFSGFISSDPQRAVHNQEVKKATQRLFSYVIPWTAISLDQVFGSRETFFYTLEYMHRVCNFMHSFGTNMRYAVRVMKRSKCIVTKHLLIVEVVARSAKKLLREVMRNCVSSTRFDRTLEKSIVNFYNAVFSWSHQSHDELWVMISEECQSYYGALDFKKVAPEVILDEVNAIPNGFGLLFERLNESVGCKWRHHPFEAANIASAFREKETTTSTPSGSRRKKSGRLIEVKGSRLKHIGVVGPHESPTPLRKTGGGSTDLGISQDTKHQMFFVDDLELVPVTKLNNLAAHSSAVKFMKLSEETNKPELRHYFRDMAIRSFEAALRNNPVSHTTTRCLAQALELHECEKLGVHVKKRGALQQVWWNSNVRYINTLYWLSLQSIRESPTLEAYARFLLMGPEHGKWKAIWNLLQAVSIDPVQHAEGKELLVKLLQEEDMDDIAAKIQQWGESK